MTIMLIEEVLNIDTPDVAMAKRLIECGVYMENEELITEAATKVVRFNYERAKHDPRPTVLILGRWMHPRTNNKLAVGLNLNYLDKSEIDELNNNIVEIMSHDNLKDRWWAGYRLMPNIWRKAYRQFDERFIHSIESGVSLDPSQHKDTKSKTPKDTKKKSRFSKGLLKRIINALKNKFRRKKLKAQDDSDEEDKDYKIDKEIDNLNRIEAEYKSKIDNELKDLDNIEDEGEDSTDSEIEALKDIEREYSSNESINYKLDVICENVYDNIYSNKLKWKSPNNYIYWHSPDKFIEYNAKLNGRVIDYASGDKIVCVYNLLENQIIMDLCNDINKVLLAAGWKASDTIQVVVDDKIYIHNQDLIEYVDNDEWKIVEDIIQSINTDMNIALHE